jgi:hypothetical protein
MLRRRTDQFERRRRSYVHIRRAGGAEEAPHMTTPKVTEIRRPLQGVTPDPFIGAQVPSSRLSEPRR